MRTGAPSRTMPGRAHRRDAPSSATSAAPAASAALAMSIASPPSGAPRMRVDKRDQRWVVVNVDPVTDAQDPEILRTISRARQACLGVYGSVVTPGVIGVGDPVMLDA